MDVKIHTIGLTGDHASRNGEKPGVQFRLILEIDGRLYDRALNARVLAGADDFSTVMVRLAPSTLETVNHTDESWKQLLDRIDLQ